MKSDIDTLIITIIAIVCIVSCMIDICITQKQILYDVCLLPLYGWLAYVGLSQIIEDRKLNRKIRR